MRAVSTLLLLAGCWPVPEADPCLDPEIWHAPDGSGDTYWGCDPPQGWTSEPPETSPTGDTGAS